VNSPIKKAILTNGSMAFLWSPTRKLQTPSGAVTVCDSPAWYEAQEQSEN